MRRLIPLVVLTVVVACSGGGSGSQNPVPVSPESQTAHSMVIAQTATPTPMPSILIEPGGINGLDNQFTPNDGDTSRGGNGQTVDGIPCAPSMVENKYHVHAFVGIMVNGKEIALPDAIGMYLSGAESNGYTNSAKCFYYIHTHDATGLVHFESPSTASLGTSIYTLGNFLDVWGQTITSTSFGPFTGPLHIFYALTPLGNLNSGTYYQYSGAPRAIAFHSHEAIWIEVGSTYVPASRLPKIRFYTQY
jgi:hypothetical protein